MPFEQITRAAEDHYSVIYLEPVILLGRVVPWAVALCYVIVLSCPAYCRTAAAPATTAPSAEAENSHAHHHAVDDAQGETVSPTLKTPAGGCCGSCGAEMAPVRATAKADNAVAHTVALVDRSLIDGPHLAENRRGTIITAFPGSPPGSSLTPLRI